MTRGRVLRCVWLACLARRLVSSRLLLGFLLSTWPAAPSNESLGGKGEGV